MNSTWNDKSPLPAILSAGLLAGTLDISAATIQTLIYGRNPIGLFQFIASGVFGETAFSGGLLFAFLGVLFHYCIAMIWTVLFFLLLSKMKFLWHHPATTGLIFGIFVWFVMNLVILPLSNIPPLPFRLIPAAIGMGILILTIGMPVSFLASRYFSRNE